MSVIDTRFDNFLLGWQGLAGATASRRVTIVLLPSLGTTVTMFDGLIEALQTHDPQLSVIVADLPGHGAGAIGAGFTIEELADEVGRVLRGVGIRSAYVLGVSMGGAIALESARRHPDVVRGFAMVNSGTQFGTSAIWDSIIESVLRSGLPAQRDTSANIWFSTGFAKTSTAQRLLNQNDTHHVITYVACCRALEAYDGEHDLPAMRTPSLLIGTVDDAASSATALEGLATRLGQSQYVKLANGRHLSLVEHASMVGHVISKWMDDVSD